MGRAAGGLMPHRPEQQVFRYSRINDFRAEHMMLSGAGNPASGGTGTGLPVWRQQVQYAVGHTLNDFYSLQPEVRRETPIQFLLERRWPPKGNAFPSLMHYWDVKTAIADELMRIVSGNHLPDIPVKLYEQWHVQVPELEIELAMIFQLVWNSQMSGRCLKIQKFMVSGQEDLITGFLHMSNVFCHKAYGKPAETVEVFSLLDGARHCYDGSGISLTESLDYVRLLAVTLKLEEEAEQAARLGGRAAERPAACFGGYGLM
ncbi:hypothetical protein [Paenibacillus tepidiphilus]|uniref:hypothetical protein n=1 Tax=Paenibacillus tepidiphilus TaxID=2608683 RepID=UPI00123A80A6|nr:hypothetical protein [Paenibacillus tepidiphilus]